MFRLFGDGKILLLVVNILGVFYVEAQNYEAAVFVCASNVFI